MKLRRSPRTRIAIIAIALGAALGACGGDDDSSTDGSATDAGAGRETPEDAFASGQRLCRILGGSETFELNYGTSDPVAQASRFAQEVYVGSYPRQAARGCLKTLRAEGAGDSE